MRRQLRLHNPFATRRAKLLLATWGAFTLGVLTVIWHFDLQRAQARLDELGRSFLQHASDRALVSETAVEGFAAFVASLERLEYARAEEYARTLLHRYPYLYMFEVVQRVLHGERPAFERDLAARFSGFQIKRFGYEGDRTWQRSEPAEFYYPIVFQEPLLDGPANLLGLDIHSSAFLREAMRASFERGEPVATHPFELAEGGRGYVLHRSVAHVGLKPPSAFESPAYALLALKAERLFAVPSATPARLSLKLRHRDFEAHDQRSEILSVPAAAVSSFEAWALPRFEKELRLGLSSQPFVIHLNWQLGWGDLSLPLMAAVLLGSLLLLAGVRLYARQFIGDELLALENEGRLYELANFDPLTGLPNRNRLMDFFETALARARRREQRLSVLFIDVDEFKTVNDRHGHSAGDVALVEVARRLSQHLREEDLLARYGGDEFVWVAATPLTDADLDALIQRLRQEFEDPIRVKRLEFRLGISVGKATYPQSGNNIAALLDAADEAMYRDKNAARVN